MTERECLPAGPAVVRLTDGTGARFIEVPTCSPSSASALHRHSSRRMQWFLLRSEIAVASSPSPTFHAEERPGVFFPSESIAAIALSIFAVNPVSSFGSGEYFFVYSKFYQQIRPRYQYIFTFNPWFDQ